MSKKDEALKLALEALSPWAGEDANHTEQCAAYHAIREALAEQPAQQEPVEWLTGCPECGMDGGCDCDSGTWNPPAQQQEPYGWKVYGVNSLFMGEFAEADAKAEAKRIGGTCITFPLYTSPPASTPWVGLTDEEKAELFEGTAPYYNELDYANDIEAKLKEKNT